MFVKNIFVKGLFLGITTVLREVTGIENRNGRNGEAERTEDNEGRKNYDKFVNGPGLFG